MTVDPKGFVGLYFLAEDLHSNDGLPNGYRDFCVRGEILVQVVEDYRLIE